MSNEFENQYLYGKIFAELSYDPNTNLVTKQLKLHKNIPQHKGFRFERSRKISIEPFLKIDDERIEKFILNAELGFYDKNGKQIDFLIKDFSMEIYVVTNESDKEYSDPILLGLDELIFHLNAKRNEETKNEYNFPTLDPCIHTDDGAFNYITEGRRIHGLYFSEYKGQVLDLYFNDELIEIYTVITDTLAFLYRNKDRVFGEIRAIKHTQQNLEIYLFARFNNAISEVAGGIYNFWERMAFIINEFFPLDPLSHQAPSYDKYFRETAKKIKIDPKLNNDSFDWLFNRLGNEHKKLVNLRHPTIHYNKNRTPSGMRSADMMKHFHTSIDPVIQEKTWSEELEFLKSELSMVSIGLEKIISLIETWAVTKNLAP